MREEQGVRFFDINDDGEDKWPKTANSKRISPIHPMLIELGLLEPVTRQKRRGEVRLFPEMPMGEDGYYSSPYSKKFRHFLDVLRIKRSKNAFHSFRHSFEDACRDIPKEIMDTLQGYGEEGMSGRYGRGYVLTKLNEAMEQLCYQGLDLGHLRPENPTEKSESASSVVGA